LYELHKRGKRLNQGSHGGKGHATAWRDLAVAGVAAEGYVARTYVRAAATHVEDVPPDEMARRAAAFGG
jgi:hypothetical protein